MSNHHSLYNNPIPEPTNKEVEDIDLYEEGYNSEWEVEDEENVL